MHSFIVSASIQLLPIVEDKHPYLWVDEAIAVIQKSNLKFEIGAFATVVEGRYDEVIGLINNINEHLLEKGCSEWISNIQIQIRKNEDITSAIKINQYKSI